jgi:hypothetical protein
VLPNIANSNHSQTLHAHGRNTEVRFSFVQQCPSALPQRRSVLSALGFSRSREAASCRALRRNDRTATMKPFSYSAKTPGNEQVL